jgi:transposase-like protein
MLSKKRNMDAAQRFFQQALETTGHVPEQVTTDGHGSYPRAIRETLGEDVLHQCHHYLNNLLEQDHRGIRTTVLSYAWGWRASPRQHASVAPSTRFVSSSDTFRTTGQSVSLAQQRDLVRERLNVFNALIVSA